MKRTKEMRLGETLLRSAVLLILALMMAMFARGFSIVSHAESAAKVTATTANIRKTPDVSSETIGSAVKDKVISIKSQVQGSDGYTWYEVYNDANTLGYIRADLVEITDGTTPPTGTVPTTTTTTPAPTTSTPVPDETVVPVTAVNPAEALVKVSKTARIRQNASTSSRILMEAPNGMALTITGTAAGNDGKTWYQVTFLSNGSEVSGFIRADYTNVKEEDLTPYTEETPTDEPDSEDQPEYTEPADVKAYDTLLQDGTWILVDNEAGQGYIIQELFDGVTQNAELYEASEKTGKTQKAVIIVLVILLVAAAAAITLLVFKVKDMTDAQYFNEVERETINRRSTRPQGGGQRMTGGERQGGRPVGSSQGQRPQGSRPAGSLQGGRPAGAAQGRPAGSSQGSRPAGAAQGRPAGSSQGQPRQAAQGQKTAQQSSQSGSSQGQQGPGWQSKNFMADDDEFEFEFLNYEGDEEK